MNKKPLDKDYYSVVFHYNTYTEIWNCIPRDKFQYYLNGPLFGQGATVQEAFKKYQETCQQDK
jgi:hypothetical protein